MGCFGSKVERERRCAWPTGHSYETTHSLGQLAGDREAETAAGRLATVDPVETVEAMVRICREAEKSADVKLDREFLDRVFTRVDHSEAVYDETRTPRADFFTPGPSER